MRYLLILLCFCCVLSACRKKAVCKGACVDVPVYGRVYDATTNKGIANHTVEVKWRYAGFCIFSCSQSVRSVQTDNNGDFNFIASVDTSMFSKRYSLDVVTTIPQGYIDDYGLISSQGIYNYTPAWLTNIDVPVLPKTSITLRLHRILADNFTYYNAETYFQYKQTGMYSQGYRITSPSQAKDTTLNIETAADVKTYIISRKTTAPGVSTEKKDSIVCTKQGPNVFDVYY